MDASGEPSNTAAGDDRAQDGGTADLDDGGDPCVEDRECNDGIFCNGEETCVQSRCRPGTPPCSAGPEANGCTVSCSEGPDGPVCATEAADVDQDGQFSTQCSVQPGQDCNDADETIFVGAEEVCDGVDRDCDGLEDIDEGFALSGTTTRLGSTNGFDKAAAWSEELGVHGVYRFGSDSTANPADQQRFFTIDRDGQASQETFLGTTTTTNSVTAAGHGGFGHAYQASGGTILFQRRGPTGTPILDAVSVDSGARDPAIVATPAGWVVGWVRTTGGAVQLRRLNIEGELEGATPRDVGFAASFGGGPSMVFQDNEITIVHSDADNALHFGRFTTDLLRVGNDVPLGLTGSSAYIAAGAQGFGLVWQETFASATAPSTFAFLDPQGLLVCGPVPVSTHASGDVTDMFGAAVAADGDRFLIAVMGEDRVITLVRVDTTCNVNERRLLLDDSSQFTKGRMELHGGNGFVVAWREPNGVQSYFRRFGPNLCD